MPQAERVRASIHGAISELGFRPFVFRLAKELGLSGLYSGSPHGVIIEAEGSGAALRQFIIRLEREKPAHATFLSFEFSFLDAVGHRDFTFQTADPGDLKAPSILPDMATCAHCVRDIFQPNGRRHRYPFTTCLHCGPRFTVSEEQPFKRPNTSMKAFKMCPQCEREFNDPADRRFQASLNACPVCGPQIELWDRSGDVVARVDEAMHRAATEIRAGNIVALKGLGGFQLVCDARNEAVVKRLRHGKNRSEKPFALMYPTLDLAREHCRISEMEERLLLAPESPIVLLQRWSPPLAPSIAPGNPNFGVMLPHTPLHHVLLRELGFPVVVASGNRSDEPICTSENQALERLGGIADYFLVHDRPIVRPVDDSVVRVVRGREMILRRARGYAPLPVQVGNSVSGIFAVGTHRLNSSALGFGSNVFISQPLGDLESSRTRSVPGLGAADLPRLFELTPEIVACDFHPDHTVNKSAAQVAVRYEARLHPVQHHWAHVLSCMAENEVPFPALGVVWDSAGFGDDGTMWGGEFFLAQEDSWERVSHFHRFRLAGMEPLRQPCRTALSVLSEALGSDSWKQPEIAATCEFTEADLQTIRRQVTQSAAASLTSSAGLLFDAVASLAGIRQHISFAGQAAMDLEFAIHPCVSEAYSFLIKSISPSEVDWRPMIGEILEDVRRAVEPGVIAAKFHNAMVEVIVSVARHVGQTRVVLSGDCFQNRYLTERSVQRLLEEGFRPYWHQRVPTNDGGIALGQVMDAARHAAGIIVRKEPATTREPILV